MSITDPIFSESQVIGILETNPGIPLSKIQEKLGCGKSTAQKLVFRLLDSGQIQREDVGKPKKPIFLYYPKV